jgi:hypothetical protein
MVEHFDNRASSLDFGAGARTKEHQAPTPRRWGRGLGKDPSETTGMCRAEVWPRASGPALAPSGAVPEAFEDHDRSSRAVFLRMDPTFRDPRPPPGPRGPRPAMAGWEGVGGRGAWITKLVKRSARPRSWTGVGGVIRQRVLSTLRDRRRRVQGKPLQARARPRRGRSPDPRDHIQVRMSDGSSVMSSSSTSGAAASSRSRGKKGPGMPTVRAPARRPAWMS